MPFQVTVNNTVFNLPLPGDPPEYAEDLAAFYQAVADVLNSQSGPLDIIETDFSFDNNISTPTDVQGFAVITANIAAFTADYVIKRVNGSGTITEAGQIFGRQGSAGWSIGQGNITSDSTLFDGFSGVSFDITTGGQLQYQSTDYTAQTEGVITFKMKAISQD